jgi:hypothetical protein
MLHWVGTQSRVPKSYVPFIFRALLGRSFSVSDFNCLPAARKESLPQLQFFACICVMFGDFYSFTSTDYSADLASEVMPGLARGVMTHITFAAQLTINQDLLQSALVRSATSMIAIAWKFLGLGQSESEAPLDALYALGRRIRKADREAELAAIEEEIDEILRAQRAKAATGDEMAVDAATLNVAAHRLESLIHDRRGMLAKKPVIAPAA